MGLFVSYCKRCNSAQNWFIHLKDGIKKCQNCGHINTEKDMYDSLWNEHYWDDYRLLESRKEKILKLKKSIH